MLFFDFDRGCRDLSFYGRWKLWNRFLTWLVIRGCRDPIGLQHWPLDLCYCSNGWSTKCKILDQTRVWRGKNGPYLSNRWAVSCGSGCVQKVFWMACRWRQNGRCGCAVSMRTSRSTWWITPTAWKISSEFASNRKRDQVNPQAGMVASLRHQA